KYRPVFRTEHDHRRHRASRALSRLGTVGARSPIHLWPKREVRQLIVQHEAAHHDSRAERVLDAAGERSDIALLVDHAQMHRRWWPNHSVRWRSELRFANR